MSQKIVVAGISTEIGKTVTSAILVEALQADYWKPVQSGALEDSDTETVRRLISNPVSRFHPEAYRLREPLSPHAAAEIDGVTIDIEQITLPETNNALIVELAGGLLVPLNDHDLNIDLVQRWQLPVVLVSRNYLGSINHTLLSVEALRSRQIPIPGIIFNGPTTPATESFILNYTGLPCLGRIGQEPEITKDVVSRYATGIQLPALY
ncbi:dethiobiotin synthase [Spirosoma montaniterrae]|uniref:ATP-dependent dethiobiotin synthetase BioD n=1 Tax=Spirosoma montaniterrae TaxID=1178516 RepID=A0A1P9X4P4_9BACT|nr:dethiobiotin synthase [Spirosoma montaniterrae]AQG82599.1 ATP-dependent dethiobiotin synthetase BioD [Spirosoma montaniterrae]